MGGADDGGGGGLQVPDNRTVLLSLAVVTCKDCRCRWLPPPSPGSSSWFHQRCGVSFQRIPRQVLLWIHSLSLRQLNALVIYSHIRHFVLHNNATACHTELPCIVWLCSSTSGYRICFHRRMRCRRSLKIV